MSSSSKILVSSGERFSRRSRQIERFTALERGRKSARFSRERKVRKAMVRVSPCLSLSFFLSVPREPFQKPDVVERKRKREREKVHCSSPRGPTRRRRKPRREKSALFMAILILKWYLMSHQHRADLSDGRARSPRHYCVELAIVVRIHTCVLVRPCCRCQALLPHTGVQTTVSSYRMVHHGVSVTYTLFGYPASSAPPSTPLSPTPFLRVPQPRGPRLSRSLPVSLSSLPLACGSCRTVDPATKMFCKTNVCICTLDRARNPIVGGDVNRR